MAKSLSDLQILNKNFLFSTLIVSDSYSYGSEQANALKILKDVIATIIKPIYNLLLTYNSVVSQY